MWDTPWDSVSRRPAKRLYYQSVTTTVVSSPKDSPGGANLHEVNTTEIYYMVEGVATLVTGGALTDP